MIRTLSFVFLAVAFSPLANAAANQRSCPASYPISMTINYGDNVSTNCKITAAGQIALVAFQGNTGDKITIVLTSSWPNGPCIGLYDPTNAKLQEVCGPYAYVISSDVTLAKTGQYTIRVHDISFSSTGTFGLMLDCWSPVVVASPLVLGQTSNGTTVHTETIDDWTFSGTTGEDVTLQVNSSYPNGPCFTLVGSAGLTVGSACGAYAYQARGEYTLPATGTYTVRVFSLGSSSAGTYSVLAQCLAFCTAPGPVYPSVNVALTGCTTACTNGNTFSATLNTTNLPNKTTELKLGFILPDGTTAAVGDPHLEIPGQFNFNGQVLSGPIVAAHPRGGWSLCARIIELNHGETLAASCQPFTIQ